MISTVAELLNALMSQEVKMLDQQKIAHAPTIGNMYEGLTRNILELALPSGLDLKVVSGFVTNKAEHISKQIDCMLVEGDGENIPYTDTYKYDIDKVIAIIEVKKNLYSNELDSAYKNLASVRVLQKASGYANSIFINAHKQILQSDPMDFDGIDQSPFWKRRIALSLFQESILPIRIAIGYHGFASEFSFREAFVNYLLGKIPTGGQGYGPVDMPNLIISESYSLIKLSGAPYGIPVFTERQDLFSAFGLHEDLEDMPPITTNLWALYASYPTNPVLLFLQLLWTRLQYTQKVSSEIFGLDLDVEFLRPLILAKAIERDNEAGWHYEYFYLSEKFLESIPVSLKWQPIEINKEQAIILMYLGEQENNGKFGLSVYDTGLLEQLEQPNLLAENLNLLAKANIISLENDKFKYLTEECKVVVLPDGRVFAWDNSDPRLMDWVMQDSNRFK
jgi:hypothetical protein